MAKATSNKFAFLQSPRFWKLAIIGALTGLKSQGFIDDGLLSALTYGVELWLGGSVIIGTVDRATEKLGN